MINIDEVCINRSVESFEFAEFPVLEAAIREVPSDDEGDSFFTELLFCDGKGVPVHERVAVGCQVERRVFGDLDSPHTDNSGLFVLGHERRSDSLSVGFVVHDFIFLDHVVSIVVLFFFRDAFELIVVLVVSVFVIIFEVVVPVLVVFVFGGGVVVVGLEELRVLFIEFGIVFVVHSLLDAVIVFVHFYLFLKDVDLNYYQSSYLNINWY